MRPYRPPQGNSKFVPSRTRPLKTSLVAIVQAMIFTKRVRKHIKKSKYRQNILSEWLNTENSYLRDLSSAVNLIREPMLKAQLINDDDAKILFPEFQGMIQLSRMMIKVIDSAKQKHNPNQILIGKQLNSFANGYKLYGGYFGTHSKSQKLLALISREREKEMKEVEADLQANVKKVEPKKQNMTIKDCMEQPLYRLFKYVLLLKEYVKKLPPQHPDYAAANTAMETFHEINNSNNELMKSLQEQEKRVKLATLFGGALKEARSLLTEMQADTIYFNSKLYIFNDMIIITKIQSVLGSEKQQLYLSMELNQFGFVGLQDDMKYFKNILQLIGTEQCIHFLFPDEGSRFELYKYLQKILKELRARAHERRKVEGNQKIQMQKGKKITFTLSDKTTDEAFQPEFRNQILGFQVRPLSTMSNDTVYVTRFMIPYYYQDQINFLQGEDLIDPNKPGIRQQITSPSKLKRYSTLPFGQFNPEEHESARVINSKGDFRCINQRIEVHFSLLQQIYKEMSSLSQEKLPNIDPVTKDVNIYSKGKRKTKLFEMRKFFIEEFFNFVFRQPDIMRSPIRFVRKLRINQSLWNYVIERNLLLKNCAKEKEETYGYQHCYVCSKGKVKSLQEFEHYRGYYLTEKKHRQNKPKDKYCFNFFNLVRMRLLSFKYISFNNLERVLTFCHYLDGRLDYPFLPHLSADKVVKMIKIHLPSLDEHFVTVVIDNNSAAGQVVDELCKDFGIKVGFDYDLVALYNGRPRILDRDQFVADIVKTLQIEFQEMSADSNEPMQGSKPGFFTTIKKWGGEFFSSDEKNKIYFMKTVYLHKSLELRSFLSNHEKRQLQTERIFWEIKKGTLRLNERQMIQMCGLFYCLKELESIDHFSPNKMAVKTIQKLLPGEYMSNFLNRDQFRKQIGYVVERQKSYLIKNKKTTDKICQRIIEMVADKTDYHTYYMQVEVRQVPVEEVKGQPPVTCLIGINYKQFIMTKSQMSTNPLVVLKLDDIEFTVTVFSLFISHDSLNYRFDSKMFFHFGELMRKYQTVRNNFPQHRV